MNSINTDYDVIIVGGGPAGLTAGIYTTRSGLKTLILEEKSQGGLMSEAILIENYPGFPDGITGLELANRMVLQARKFGAQINSPEKTIELHLEGETKFVRTEKQTYRAQAVILSLGSSYRRLNVPGELELLGKGVSYCAVCDGRFFKGKRVLVVGGGNSTAMTAIYLSALVSDVKMIHRRDSLRADDVLQKQLRNSSVEIILNTKVTEIRGDAMVKDVVLEDVRTGSKRIIEADGVFVQIGEDPSSLIAKNAGVKTDEDGYILVDDRQRTNFAGVYASGDVTVSPVKQVGTAIGQAIVAAVEAFAYIKKPYYYP